MNPQKIGKFKASRIIVRESWRVLMQDKELAWFPVLSAITSLLALLVLGIVFFYTVMGGNIHAFENINEQNMEVLGYIVLFIYYLVVFFIANYFITGIYIIVHGRFNGQNLSFKDGIDGAKKNFGKIFIWSLISATVGVVLRLISDKSKLLGKIVALLLGAVWHILTYFSLPLLVIGNKSVIDSFKESAALIRKTWGEVIIVNFGVGLFFGLITMGIFALALFIVLLAPVLEVFIIVGILFIISVTAISVIQSTLSSIFKLAIYEFAVSGNPPVGFSPDLIKGAVSGK
jgi:hypothetical protein